ncbi:MAG: hypothetical protein AABM67_16860 [Acidobacteriota bacterium]
MAKIKCAECSKPVDSPPAVLCPECEISLNDPQAKSTFKADNKERFELGIGMMKEYYAAIEMRLAATLTFYGIIIGWLLTSEGARTALNARGLLALVAGLALTIGFILYIWNILHWLGRWRYIRGHVILLNHMERRYYTRYEQIPPRTWLAYILPVGLMYVLILGLLIGIAKGWVPAKMS